MKLDSISVLFAGAWRRLQEQFAVVVSITIVPLIFMGIGRLLIYEDRLSTVLLGGIFNFIGVILSFFSAIALMTAFGKKTDFAASYGVSVKLFWAWVWVTILATLAIMGGFVMLIVPGIMLAIQLGFATYVLVLEGRRGMAALATSREYLKGYWWAFVGRAILVVLCLAAAMFVLFVPATLIFGHIVGGLVYGIILLVFIPFSVAFHYEIYQNLRRLKPEVAEASKKSDGAFLKVSIVVGIVGWVFLLIAIVAAAVFLPAMLMRLQEQYPNGYGNYMPNDQIPPAPNPGPSSQVIPSSGPVGTKVTVPDPDHALFSSTNTVLMNGYVAARNVVPAANGSLSFSIPSALTPDCPANQPCPQFALPVMPGVAYPIDIEYSAGEKVWVGSFTVTSK